MVFLGCPNPLYSYLYTPLEGSLNSDLRPQLSYLAMTTFSPYCALICSPAALYVKVILPPLSFVAIIFPKASVVLVVILPYPLTSFTEAVFPVMTDSIFLPVKEIIRPWPSIFASPVVVTFVG